MPGQFRLSLDQLASEADELRSLGVRAVLLFGIPASKDPQGTEGYASDGIVQQAVRALKQADPELAVIADICLCEYTDHGHCGLLTPSGEVDNDPSLELLSRMAVSMVEAGADVVAPCDMMDGRVGAIREALDDSGFESTPIMAYSAKYASAYYGPFREAADSAPAFGDRRGYQMDPANAREALREVEADILEDADIVMVKPALAYLDVIARVRDAHRPAARGVQRLRRVRDGEGSGGERLAGRARASPSKRSPPSAALAPTSSSRTTPRRRRAGCGSECGLSARIVRGSRNALRQAQHERILRTGLCACRRANLPSPPFALSLSKGVPIVRRRQVQFELLGLHTPVLR